MTTANEVTALQTLRLVGVVLLAALAFPLRGLAYAVAQMLVGNVAFDPSTEAHQWTRRRCGLLSGVNSGSSSSGCIHRILAPSVTSLM